MNFPRTMLFAATIIGLTISNPFAFDETVTGTAKVKVTGGLMPEQMTLCQENARSKFKQHLLVWLDQEKNVKVDTTDVLSNLLFQSFLDSCLNHSLETPGFKGDYWTFSFSIMPASIISVLTAYNDRIELLAVHSLKRLENAVEQKNYEEIYYQSVEVIAHAVGHLGPALTVPGDSGKPMITEAREILKKFLGRISITTTGQLLDGKPGYAPASPPSLKVTIEGHPFAGLGLTGYIPGGVDVFNGVADNEGTITFQNLVIPFVRNGSMMYVTPNLGRVIDNRWHLGMKNFGLDANSDLNQSFFFKVTKPTFKLTFEAADADPMDTLPKDFISGATVKNYLIDSCGLTPAGEGATADLNITIKCQVSSANSEAYDAGEAKFEGMVSIQAPLLTPPRKETEKINFEKKYDQIPYEILEKQRSDKMYRMATVPLGDFMWESNIKLRTAIRKILDRL